jgi:hypothetical protein
MGCHIGSLLGGDVYYDLGARWSERTLVEVEVAIEAGIGGELGLATR